MVMHTLLNCSCRFKNVSFCTNIVGCFRFIVSYCPTLPEDGEMITFLQALGIDWPTAPTNCTHEEQEERILEALENSSYREREVERGRRISGGGRKPEEGEMEGALRVNLKRAFQEEGLLGYDPSLGTCTGEASTTFVTVSV